MLSRYFAACLCWLMLISGGCARFVTLEPIDSETVQIYAAQLVTAGACPLTYRVYQPTAVDSRGLVILGHGFLRSQDQMVGLATVLAASGVRVATLDYCHSRLWRGGHVQNGLDMVRLARELTADTVVYAGFSAGGLAALIAADHDPQAVGVLTLDLVDSQDLGRQAAQRLQVPLIGLTGEPTNCNAYGNGEPIFAIARQAQLTKIDGAGHCIFETPTDSLCEFLCTQPEPTQRANQQAAMLAKAVAALSQFQF